MTNCQLCAEWGHQAVATLNLAVRLYNDQAAALRWSCYPQAMGFVGTGSIADHSMIMICQGLVTDITSLDSDTAHVIIVINKAP